MKKPKPPQLVTVAIFTTITVIFWIFFEVYETLSSAPSVSVNEDILSPLNPTLDTATLQKLEIRTFFNESDVENIRFSVLSPLPTTAPLEETPLPESETNNIEKPSENTSPESE